MKTKTQVLNDLAEWSQKNGYLMKPITSRVRANNLTLEIIFINERLNVISFIIEITRFETGKWSLTSFTEMFETAHCRFNYIQGLLN